VTALRRAIAACLVVLPIVALRPVPAAAHPLGNFTINTSARIVVLPERFELTYLVDMAEIPTFQELERIDGDGDGVPSAGELDAWANLRAEELLADLELDVDGTPVALERASSSAELLPGQAGLSVLRLEARYVSDALSSGSATFIDRAFRGRAGWREVVVTARDGASARDSSVPADSPSAGLTSYPTDLLASPLNVTRASFSFSTTGGTVAGSASVAAVRGVERPATDGGLAGLVASAGRTPWLFAISLLVAFGFGAVHSMGPGHGKTLVAAYLFGGQRRLRHATTVGLAVALMHTASVLVLGGAILAAGRSFAPEVAYPWLGTLAGAVAVVVGATLLVSRVRRRPAVHGHRHDHAHPAGHQRGDGHPHEHRHEQGAGSWRTIGGVALAGGILPSPSALLALLAAIALGRLELGLALIAAFSLGLAAALIAVGAATVRARDLLAPRLSGRWGRLAPVGSAAAIVALGLLMTARGVLSL
jgi:ABC-type nickel/cobalt efflux system permease component RcnA